MSYTTNPRATGDGQTVQENPGFVASDSLAAESLQGSDSGFASNQAGIAAQSVRGAASTANNTDTSGATTLPSADDKTQRIPGRFEAGEYQTPAGENSESARRGETYESVGLPGGRTGPGASYDTTRGGPQESYAGDAPGYATQGLNASHAKPKGTNITEGGFDSDAPNASFNSEIGSRKDPGRVAEQQFENSNARAGGDAGYPGASNPSAGVDQGGFENLDRDTSA